MPRLTVDPQVKPSKAPTGAGSKQSLPGNTGASLCTEQVPWLPQCPDTGASPHLWGELCTSRRAALPLHGGHQQWRATRGIDLLAHVGGPRRSRAMLGGCRVPPQWDTPPFLQPQVLAEVRGVPARLSDDLPGDEMPFPSFSVVPTHTLLRLSRGTQATSHLLVCLPGFSVVLSCTQPPPRHRRSYGVRFCCEVSEPAFSQRSGCWCDTLWHFGGV